MSAYTLFSTGVLVAIYSSVIIVFFVIAWEEISNWFEK